MKTLIIPTVGVSNVPQLVVQKLLEWNSSTYLKKLDPSYLYPYVATNAMVTHSPLELYTLANEIGIIQLHSPVLPGYEYQFAQQIRTVALAEGIDRIVVIDSKDRGEKIGWEWFSSGASLEHLMGTLSLSDEDHIVQIGRNATCPLVELIEDIPLDYYSVRVYEGPNAPAVGEMANLIGKREGLVVKL